MIIDCANCREPLGDGDTRHVVAIDGAPLTDRLCSECSGVLIAAMGPGRKGRFINPERELPNDFALPAEQLEVLGTLFAQAQEIDPARRRERFLIQIAARWVGLPIAVAGSALDPSGRQQVRACTPEEALQQALRLEAAAGAAIDAFDRLGAAGGSERPS